MGCSPPGCSVQGILQARIPEWVAISFSRGSSQPRDRTQVSSIAGRFFFPVEPQGKAKNTGVGSLSLLQRIFPTQESNLGLQHCRQILYQLSYQGSHQLQIGQMQFKSLTPLHFKIKGIVIIIIVYSLHSLGL